jgi:hypothetical protein
VLQVFIGIDPRQPLAYTVLQNSIIRRASKPVRIVPLLLSQLPITRRGLTEFTFSRFYVPGISRYRGVSIFMDADMLVLCDIYDLLEHHTCLNTVTVAQHQQHFEWPSLMIFTNAACKKLTPEFINSKDNKMFDFKWAKSIGNLPPEYNYCVGYDPPIEDAKIVHFTQGIPCFPETENSPYRKEWYEELEVATSTVSWKELMGNSVHAQRMHARV